MNRLLSADGSSILEALAATVVIGVGILAMALLTGGLVKGNRKSDLVGSASFAVQDQMERLLAEAPLGSSGGLALGPHPPDVGGSPRYEGLDAQGSVASASVAAGSSGHEFLRRWVVTSEASSRCLRRVRVSIWDEEGSIELAAAEALVNCP